MFLPTRSVLLVGQVNSYASMASVISVVGDTFADIVCRPVEKLPSWGQVSLKCALMPVFDLATVMGELAEFFQNRISPSNASSCPGKGVV